MANREIVVSLRLSEGTTREQFRALKSALIDIREEITANNRDLRTNAKAQAELSAEVKAAGVITEAQAAKERVLREERARLKIEAANLAESEKALSIQYRGVGSALSGLDNATEKLRQSTVESAAAVTKQRDALASAQERTKELASAADKLFNEFEQGKSTPEVFTRINSALVDTRAELTKNNAAIRVNGKETDSLKQKIREEGQATEEQAARLKELVQERSELQAINGQLKISEGQLSAVLREVGNDVKGLTEAGLRFRDKMADATTEALRQSGVLGQLGARMDFLRSEQDRLNREQQEGKVTQEQYRASMEKLEAEEQQLIAQTTQLNAKIDALTREYKEGRITQEQFREGVNGVNTAVKSTEGAVRQGVTDLKNYALGFVGVVAVAQGAVNVIKNVGKSVAKFQQENTNLAAILGTTRDKITELTDSALRIGPAFGRAPEEVTQLQTELAKLGFTVPEILAAQEAVITLANATGETLGKSAEVAAATLNGFNLTAEETGRVVDVIAQAANASSLDLEKFSVAMATVAPAANQAGFSIEETTALVGVLADRGLDASSAGTALRSMFIDLSKTGQTFDQAMAEINASTNKTKTAFDLFGERAAGAAVILAEAGDETRNLTDALNNAGGAAKKVAEEQLDTLSGSVKQLEAAWKAFVLRIDEGNGVISQAFKGAVGSATQLLEILSGTNKFQNFKNELEDITDKAHEAADGMGFLQRTLTNVSKAIALDPDGLLDQLGIGVVKRQKDVGNLLTEFNNLKEGIALTTDAAGNLKELNIAPDEQLDQLVLFAKKIRFEVARARAQAVSGTLTEDEAIQKQQSLLQILDKVGVAVTKASADRVKAAQDNVKAVKSEVETEEVAAGTIAAKRKELGDSLERAKEKRDSLNASDVAGIAAADKEIESIQRSISSLDSRKTKTEEVNTVDRERVRLVEELTKAEEARARVEQVKTESLAIQAADPTITAPQADELAALVVQRDERIALANGEKETLLAIEQDYQAQAAAIRERYAAQQVSDQDAANAALRDRSAAIAQQQLDDLIARQNAELILAAQNGEDLQALAEAQAQERAGLVGIVEDAAIQAKMEAFDAEYAEAVLQGTDLLALTQTQQEELAALKQSFRDTEITKTNEFNDALIAAQNNLTLAQFGAAEGFGAAIQTVAEEGTVAAKIGFALQKAAAVAQVIVQTSQGITAALAQGVVQAGPVAGPVLAAPTIAALKINAGVSIATILAQTIKGFATGGEVGHPNGTIRSSHGKRVKRSNGDNVLITAKTGEKILNDDQQDIIEDIAGKDVWARAGVPGHGRRSAKNIVEGFDTGGIVSAATFAAAPSMAQIIQVEANAINAALADRPVYTIVSDIEQGLGRASQIRDISQG